MLLSDRALARKGRAIRAWVGLLSVVGLAAFAIRYGLDPGVAQPPQNSFPSPAEIISRMKAEATAAVDAFIAKASTADANTQRQIARFYCDQFSDLPVKDARSVHQKYVTANNCGSKGLPLLRSLAENGDVESQFQLAGYLNSSSVSRRFEPAYPQPDDAEAFKWYMAIATNAPASARPPPPLFSKTESTPYRALAANWVAYFYEHGLSITKNLERAFFWYQTAEMFGDTGASIKVADMLAKGEGTTKNIAEAIGRLAKLPDDDSAQFTLAEVYIFYGATTSDRFEKALHILGSLHDRAQSPFHRHEAAFYLGNLYYQGGGVTRNYRTAFDYFLEAARFGEPQAQRYIAVLYFDGAGALQSYGDAHACGPQLLPRTVTRKQCKSGMQQRLT